MPGLLRASDLRATGLVAALSSGFGVLLLQGTWVLTTFISGEGIAEASPTVAVVLLIVSLVFFTIALFVGAIVTTNTIGTVVAGRTADIARMRLLGATSRRLRRSITLSGTLAGLIGAAVGTVVVTALDTAAVAAAVGTGLIPDRGYVLVAGAIAVPPAAVVLVTAAAVRAGSRQVLSVSPLQAAGGAAAQGDASRGRGKGVAGAVLLVIGTLLLAGGVVIGGLTPFGLLVALPGGILSFLGVILLSERIMPPMLRLAGWLGPSNVASRLAAANAVRNPARASRATIGMVIGVTLVTMFSVAMSTFSDVLYGAQSASPGLYGDIDQTMTVIIAVFSVLFGFSAIIAAVGLVNTLSLNVMQRRREIGLLRALGLSRGQVRAMITAESVHTTAAALVTGLVLGIVYGWCGAMSLLAGLPGVSVVLPVVPLWLVVGVALAGAALAIGAALVPVRRANRVAPVRALAVE